MNGGEGSAIGIMGAGFCGHALAKGLRPMGKVWTTTTGEEKLKRLQEEGIPTVLLRVSPDNRTPIPPELMESTVLILTIPPGRADDLESTYPAIYKNLAQGFQDRTKLERVFFLSSTAVYGTEDEHVTESTPPSPEKGTARAILQVETILAQTFQERLTILRLGGLVGPGRHPGRFFSRRKETEGGDNPVNLLHRDDVVGAVGFLLSSPGPTGGVYNLCAPLHPTRREFYTLACQDLGTPPPEFMAPHRTTGKSVSPERILREGYSFLLPDPLQFSYSETEESP